MKTRHLLLTIMMTISIVFGLKAQNIWMNEIHYDNSGTDADEFIEVVLENPGNYNLADFRIFLYNGNNPANGIPYDSIELNTYTVGATSGNFTLYWYNYTANGRSIQNGPNDGISISYQGVVIPGQFLSYEGTLIAGGGPAQGQTSVDIGVSEATPPAVGMSLQLSGAGNSYLNFGWQPPATSTPGALNNNQTIGGGALPEPTNYPTNFTATPGYFKVTLHWTDATGGQLPTSYLIKGSNANNIVPPVDGTPVTDDPNLADGSAALNIFPGVQTCMFTGLSSNTPYYFAIYPYTNNGTLIDYKTDGTAPAANATTPNGVIIFHRDFNDRALSPMIAKNIQGPDQFWVIDTSHGTSSSACAKMSGYAGGVNNVNEDWLITPAMNFDLYNLEVLSFMSAFDYTGNLLAVKISNNYNGSGDPNSFTWTDLTATLSPGGWLWTSSGDINVSGANGTAIYVGFKYTSDATNASTWELDDIYVLGTPLVGIGEKTNSTEFTIFPNPSQGMVKLAFNGKGNKEINIMNVTGNKVFQETTDLTIRNIDLTNLSSGIYFVQVTDVSTSKISVKKLIIR